MIFLLFYILLIPALIIGAISFYNYFFAPVLEPHAYKGKELVSVLIPARNEEKNIKQCISFVLAQDYKNLEILVYNDNSEDNTKEEALSFTGSMVKVIDGDELTEGWTGKNFACYNLSEAARGEYLLFIDADVILKEKVISSAMSILKKKNVSLLSVFPSQIMRTAGEWFVTPLMNWFLLSFLPLDKVYNSSRVSLTAANGQFMLWEKDAYQQLGGHAQFKGAVIEDMEMSKAAKGNGLKIITLMGRELVFCRMYEGLADGVRGFSKNFYKGTNMSAGAFLFFISFMLLLYILPLAIFFIYPQFLFIFIVLSLGRGFISAPSRQNVWLNMLISPLQMGVMFYTGIRSLFFRKEILWKNRPVN